MAQHSIWEPAMPSSSPYDSSKAARQLPPPPQSNRDSARLLFNSSPGWNIAGNGTSNGAQQSTGGGSSLFPSGTANVHHTDFLVDEPAPPAVDDSTVQGFMNRYQELKTLEDYKNSLMEELLYHYEFLSEQYKKLSAEHDREREISRVAQRREKTMAENIRRMQLHLDRDPFVLVLIDGDDMIFNSELLMNGEKGGFEAAALLQENVFRHVRLSVGDLQPDTRIVARVYANIKSLAEKCYHAGVVDDPSKVEDFAKSFTNGKHLFDFIDVSGGRENTVGKLSEFFKLNLYNYHCRQIFIGASYDGGYSRFLEDVPCDQHTMSRVTILEGVPFEREPLGAVFEKARFGDLFRPSKLDWSGQETEQSINAGSQSEGILPPTTPAVTVQFSHMEIKDVKDFTPRLPQARAASVSTDSNKNSPVFTWASAVAKPPATVAPPLQATSLSLPPTSSPQIPRNRKGQRVDPVIKHDKVEVDRVKKLKMCNVHFLRNECPYGDSCSHVHSYKPTSVELQTLRLVARMAPCMHGSACDDGKCIYGHICPAPEGRDGKDCIFGDQCRFPAEMHKIDRQVVKTIKV